jgi:Tfp pilus assembly protein FimT
MERNRGSVLVDWSTAASLLATAVMFVPGVRTFIHESQRSAVVNELQIELRRALRTANDLGQPVTLCATAADGHGCADDRNWSRGWTAFVDADGDGRMGEHERSLALWRMQNSHPNIVVAAEPAAFSFRPYYNHDRLRQSTTGRITVTDRAGYGGERTIEIGYGGFAQLAPLASKSQAAASRWRMPAILLAIAALVLWWRWPRARLGTAGMVVLRPRLAPAARPQARATGAAADRAAPFRAVIDALHQALRQEPARQDLRRRLLEIHFAARHVEAFVDLAYEYRDRSRGAADPFWSDVGAMGARLAPRHAIFRQESARCA